MDSVIPIYVKRRSRMQRTSSGKRIELSPRDVSIFTVLTRYRFLRSTYIHAFVGGDATRLVKRLGDLFHEGYLDRPREQWETANARYQPAVYALGERAIAALRAQGLERDDALDGHRPEPTGAHRQFNHSLMICDIVASMELAAKATTNIRFVPWTEIRAKASAATRAAANPLQLPVSLSYTFPETGKTHGFNGSLIPDAVFGLEYTTGTSKSYRFFALEADRGTMPIARTNLEQSSFLRKILCYRQIVAENLPRQRWGVPNLLVLTATMSNAHARGIMELITARFGESALFLFKAIDTASGCLVPARSLLDTPWARTGMNELSLEDNGARR